MLYEARIARVKEFIRLIKPDGYVGFTESIWRGVDESKFDEFLMTFDTPGALMEAHDTWVRLLEGSGLVDIVTQDYDMHASKKWSILF